MGLKNLGTQPCSTRGYPESDRLRRRRHPDAHQRALHDPVWNTSTPAADVTVRPGAMAGLWIMTIDVDTDTGPCEPSQADKVLDLTPPGAHRPRSVASLGVCRGRPLCVSPILPRPELLR